MIKHPIKSGLSFLTARFYDAAMRRTERLCLGQWRRELLAPIQGEVLEIGSGTGVNLDYYSRGVHLVLSEPDRHMRRQLERRVEKCKRDDRIRVADQGAEDLDFAEGAFDAVVSTLVLCSVNDLGLCLRQIHRLLRPGGRLYFMEHVRADDNPRVARWQSWIEPFWRFCCGNCHLTRSTARAIQEHGLDLERVQPKAMLGVPAIVRPVILGSALKRK